MMSTVLHSDSLLTPAATTNPFISFNGGFTPWEKLESFFTCSDKISKSTLPNLSCYHADLVLDSESTNQTLPYCVEPNLDSYHVGLDSPPSFHKPEISRYHAESNIGSNIPNPNQHSPSFEKPSPPDQNSPISSSSSGGGSDDPIQNQPDSTLNSSFQDPPAQVASTMDERKRKRMISNRESARRSRVRKQRHVENLRNSMNELKIQTRERSNQLRLMTHQINLVKRENDRLKAESIILQRNLMQFNQIWQLQQLLQQQQRSYHHYHHPPPPSATSCTPMQLIL